jgi:cytochrome c oxidase subunit 3
VAIVSVFFVSQSSGHFDANARYINEWLPTEIPPILWLNTAILLLSSLTMEIGRRHMFREMHVMDEWLGLGKPTSKRAMPWVAATAVLGCLFLAGQVAAWRQLGAQRIHLNTSPSSHSFYLITGIHGIHLLVGVLALVAALIALFVSKQIENRQIFVDLSAWYWHSMGLLWLGLFALLRFFQ